MVRSRCSQQQCQSWSSLSMTLETDSTTESTSTNATSTTPQFGDVVSPQFGDVVSPQFGDVVSRRPPGGSGTTNTDADAVVQFGDTVSRTGGPSSASTASSATIASDMSDSVSEVARIQRRNIVTAVVAIALAVSNYVWQLSHPVTAIQLLTSMQGQSESITIVGRNAKPTVVDFWAPWCENCKLIAPTLLQVEEEYKDRVNFVMIDGDKQEAWPYIEAFGVDAIPHLALVSAKGDVETALIGPIPKHVLEADLDMLIKNAAAERASGATDLPYKMLDVFANKPDQRRLHFDN
jgi:thiol-disulfide isomerase/thioredoxin